MAGLTPLLVGLSAAGGGRGECMRRDVAWFAPHRAHRRSAGQPQSQGRREPPPPRSPAVALAALFCAQTTSGRHAQDCASLPPPACPMRYTLTGLRAACFSVRAQGGRGTAAPRSTRGRALAVAAGSILLALVAVAMAVQRSGPTRLLQLGPVHVGNVEMHHLAAPFTNLAHKGMAYFESSPAAHARAMPSAPPAKPARAVAEPAHAIKGADSNVVYYYMPPASDKGAKLAASQSKLQQMSTGNQILAAPSPGVFVAPTVGDGPAVRSHSRPSHP